MIPLRIVTGIKMNKHGGKREGSGRKKKEATQVMRIPISLVEQVKFLIASHSQPAPTPEPGKASLDAKSIILSMHKDGKTFVEIADKLNELGLVSATGKQWNRDSARGIMRRHKDTVVQNEKFSRMD